MLTHVRTILAFALTGGIAFAAFSGQADDKARGGIGTIECWGFRTEVACEQDPNSQQNCEISDEDAFDTLFEDGPQTKIPSNQSACTSTDTTYAGCKPSIFWRIQYPTGNQRVCDLPKKK